MILSGVPRGKNVAKSNGPTPLISSMPWEGAPAPRPLAWEITCWVLASITCSWRIRRTGPVICQPHWTLVVAASGKPLGGDRRKAEILHSKPATEKDSPAFTGVGLEEA